MVSMSCSIIKNLTEVLSKIDSARGCDDQEVIKACLVELGFDDPKLMKLSDNLLATIVEYLNKSDVTQIHGTAFLLCNIVTIVGCELCFPCDEVERYMRIIFEAGLA